MALSKFQITCEYKCSSTFLWCIYCDFSAISQEVVIG